MLVAHSSNSVGGWSLDQLCFLSNFLASCYDRSSLNEVFCFCFCFCFLDVLACTGLKTGCMGRVWSNLDFLSNFWRVVFIGVRCTSFFDFFGCARLHVAQTRWGWSLGQLCFLSNFLVSCFNKSLLHKFLCFIGRTSSHMAQTGWVSEAWANYDLWSYFWRVLMKGDLCMSFFFFFFRSFRSHVAQTPWVAELRFMKLFFGWVLMVGIPGQVSFLRGGMSCYDNSYLGEFPCFPQVIFQ